MTAKISCIMTTDYRMKDFVPQAIKLFLAQDYPDTELIIVDEYHEEYGSVAGVVPSRKNIVYINVDSPVHLSVGAKRNLACSVATGQIIALWSDDDYYGTSRLTKQALPILVGAADATAMQMDVYLDATLGKAWICSNETHRELFAHNVRANTLLFNIDYLHKKGLCYDNRSMGTDVSFLDSLVNDGARLERIIDASSYVCIGHSDNPMDNFDCRGPGWKSVKMVDILPRTQLPFYKSLNEL